MVKQCGFKIKAMPVQLLGLMFSFGLVLAGSDSDWFPWPNFVGCGMLALMAWWANVMERNGELYVY